MQISFEVHKIINFTIYNTVFTSGGGVDEVLVRLQLIEQVLKNVNLMCILFSVKHLQKFQVSGMSLFNMSRTICNMYTFPFNLPFVIKVESHDKKAKDQRSFETQTIIFLMERSILALVRLSFIQNIYFFIFSSLCVLVSICHNF